MASDPPRLLDVDRGTSRPVGGLPAGEDGFGVAPLGDGAVVAGDGEVFVLRRGAPPGDPGRHVAADAVASLDGARRCGCWSTGGGARCGRSAWTGRARRPAQAGARAPSACSPTPRSACSPGPSPASRRRPGRPPRPRHRACTLARYPEVHGVAGDLVLAGDFDRFGEAIAVWRPGQDHLALKRVDLPDPDGSDTFVAWPAAA